MSIGKSRGQDGKRPVYIYDPKTRGKVYVGLAPACTRQGKVRSCRCDGCKDARAFEQRKADEYASSQGDRRRWTVERWAGEWLGVYHGPNTKRPEETTRVDNGYKIRRFRDRYATRDIRSITREEAEGWGRERPQEIKAIAAMFADAVDKGFIDRNVFYRLGISKPRGREDIDPLTTAEVERLAVIAGDVLGVYGAEFAAFIRFAANEGLRPGEMCGLHATEVDWRNSIIRVEWQRRNDGSRVLTKNKQRRKTTLTDAGRAALESLPRRSREVFLSPTGKPLRPNHLRHFWLPVRAAFTQELPADHWLSRRLRHDPADHLDLYELRHHFGSWLAENGVPAIAISKQMGNSVKVCERVYLHMGDERAHELVLAAQRKVTPLRPVESERNVG